MPRSSRRNRTLLGVFGAGCALIAAATVIPGGVRNTAQGTATDREWSMTTVVYVGGCPATAEFNCAQDGEIRFTVAATIRGDELELRENLASDDLRFRPASHVECRVDKFYDSDCGRQPERHEPSEFGSRFSDTRTFPLVDAGDRAFLDLVYEVEVEGRGEVYGSRKYGGRIFIGTSWRWSCAPDNTPLECTFVG